MKLLLTLVLATFFSFFSSVSSAASLIPADTLTTLTTDLNATFSEAIGFAYPLMLTFTGGVVAFHLVKRMIKMGAKG